MTGAAAESRPIFRKLAYSILVLLAFILAVEYGARALGLQSGFFLTVTRENCMQRSELMGLEFAPNCKGTINASVANTVFETNSLGLRDSEIEDDGAIRILAIGDSCTWGWGLAQQEAYPQVLQQLLDDRMGSGRYRVINAAMPGATAYQGLRYLRARGVLLKPQIVIFGYGFNDQWKAGDVEEWMRSMSHHVWLQSFDDWLLDQSTMWRWIRWKTQPGPQPQGPQGGAARRSSPEQYGRNLTEIVNLTRQHGAKPLMIVFFARGLPEPYARALFEITVRLQVPAIIYSGGVIDVAHPTKDGARELAATIFDRLVHEGYVGAGNGPAS
jgi:lysophospholipase L1-like esterase